MNAVSGFAVFLMLVVSVQPAVAAGVALREGSADWTANAFAGEAAKAYDASTAYSNPAGMTRLNWNEADLSSTVVLPSSQFSGVNTIGGQVTPGNLGGPYAQPLLIPGGFAVWNASPDLKFGLSVTVPFGARIAYSPGFVGRYQSLVSSLTDVRISLAAAYRINEHLSIGGGPVIDILSTRLTQAVNLGPLSSAFGDAMADFRGSSVGAGFTIGALYEFDDSFRAGLVYRSRVQPTISGTQSVGFSPAIGVVSPATAATLAARTGSASTRLSLPDSVSLGFYKQIDEQWAVMADLQWIDWSLVSTLSIIPANHTPATVLPENWRNTWFGSIGANFRVTERLLLQAGVGYDLSPVTNSNRTTRIPDANRLLLGGGVTYNLLTNVSVQLAVLEVLSGTVKIDNSASPTAGVIRGSYDTEVTTVALGMTARF